MQRQTQESREQRQPVWRGEQRSVQGTQKVFDTGNCLFTGMGKHVQFSYIYINTTGALTTLLLKRHCCLYNTIEDTNVVY